METKKYDATYHLGKTTVHIVSPETVLGRKMTEEEKQKVLDEKFAKRLLPPQKKRKLFSLFN